MAGVAIVKTCSLTLEEELGSNVTNLTEIRGRDISNGRLERPIGINRQIIYTQVHIINNDTSEGNSTISQKDLTNINRGL